MRVDIEFGSGTKINAKFNGFIVESDQAKGNGGEGSAPEPFDYFDSSLALCAGFYVKSFCDQREIPTEGMKIYQESSKDPENRYKKFYTINVELPENFPAKYKRSVEMAASNCTVKKVITEGPQFTINVI